MLAAWTAITQHLKKFSFPLYTFLSIRIWLQIVRFSWFLRKCFTPVSFLVLTLSQNELCLRKSPGLRLNSDAVHSRDFRWLPSGDSTPPCWQCYGIDQSKGTSMIWLAELKKDQGGSPNQNCRPKMFLKVRKSQQTIKATKQLNFHI